MRLVFGSAAALYDANVLVNVWPISDRSHRDITWQKSATVVLQIHVADIFVIAKILCCDTIGYGRIQLNVDLIVS